MTESCLRNMQFSKDILWAHQHWQSFHPPSRWSPIRSGTQPWTYQSILPRTWSPCPPNQDQWASTSIDRGSPSRKMWHRIGSSSNQEVSPSSYLDQLGKRPAMKLVSQTGRIIVSVNINRLSFSVSQYIQDCSAWCHAFGLSWSSWEFVPLGTTWQMPAHQHPLPGSDGRRTWATAWAVPAGWLVRSFLLFMGCSFWSCRAKLTEPCVHNDTRVIEWRFAGLIWDRDFILLIHSLSGAFVFPVVENQPTKWVIIGGFRRIITRLRFSQTRSRPIVDLWYTRLATSFKVKINSSC